MGAAITLLLGEKRALEVDPHDSGGDGVVVVASRGDRAQAMQQVVHGRGDQGGTELGHSQLSLRPDDRGDLCDAQVRARERMSPTAVQLDVPERGTDPIVAGIDSSGPEVGFDVGDQAVAELQLGPARILVVTRDDFHRGCV